MSSSKGHLWKTALPDIDAEFGKLITKIKDTLYLIPDQIRNYERDLQQMTQSHTLDLLASINSEKYLEKLFQFEAGLIVLPSSLSFVLPKHEEDSYLVAGKIKIEAYDQKVKLWKTFSDEFPVLKETVEQILACYGEYLKRLQALQLDATGRKAFLECEMNMSVVVSGAFLNGFYRMNESLARRVLSINDSYERVNTQSSLHSENSDLERNNTNDVHFENGLYFKHLTKGSPSVEAAVYLLAKIIFGGGVAPSTLLVFENVLYKEESLPNANPQPTSIPASVSMAVVGKTLEEILKKNLLPPLQDCAGGALKNLNFWKTAGMWFIMSLLTGTNDAKADNFIVDDNTQNIIGIDNDLSFYSEWEHKRSSETDFHWHKPSVHSIFFYMKELREQKVSTLFSLKDLVPKDSDVHALILGWTIAHDTVTDEHLQLMNNRGGLDPEKCIELRFGRMPAHIPHSVQEKLSHMSKLGGFATYKDLLSEVSPNLAEFITEMIATLDMPADGILQRVMTTYTRGSSPVCYELVCKVRMKKCNPALETADTWQADNFTVITPTTSLYLYNEQKDGDYEPITRLHALLQLLANRQDSLYHTCAETVHTGKNKLVREPEVSKQSDRLFDHWSTISLSHLVVQSLGNWFRSDHQGARIAKLWSDIQVDLVPLAIASDLRRRQSLALTPGMVSTSVDQVKSKHRQLDRAGVALFQHIFKSQMVCAISELASLFPKFSTDRKGASSKTQHYNDLYDRVFGYEVVDSSCTPTGQTCRWCQQAFTELHAIHPRISWISTLDALCPLQERSKVPGKDEIRCGNFDYGSAADDASFEVSQRKFNPDYFRDLLNAFGDDSMTQVVGLVQRHRGLIFKYLPDLPLNELSLRLLSCELHGRDVVDQIYPNTILCNWQSKPLLVSLARGNIVSNHSVCAQQAEKNYCILTVPTKNQSSTSVCPLQSNFQELLTLWRQKEKARLSLTPDVLCQQEKLLFTTTVPCLILDTLLFDCRDGHSGNYVFETITASNSVRIVSVDNDLSLAPPEVSRQNEREGSVICHFAHSADGLGLAPEVVERFELLNPYDVFSNWLDRLLEVEKMAELLFPTDDGKHPEKRRFNRKSYSSVVEAKPSKLSQVLKSNSESIVQMQLSCGLIKIMYNRFERLKSMIESSKQTGAPIDLRLCLRKIEPTLHRFIDQDFTSTTTTATSRRSFLSVSRRGSSSRNVFGTHRDEAHGNDKFFSLVLNKKTVRFHDIVAACKMELETYGDNDVSGYWGDDDVANPCPRFNNELGDIEALSQSQLKAKFQKIPLCASIPLHRCSRKSLNVFMSIAHATLTGLALTEVNFSALGTDFLYKLFKKFPSLDRLDISNSDISAIKGEALNLRLLKAASCQRLKTLELKAPKLLLLNLEQCTIFGEEMPENHRFNFPHLQTLLVKDCPKLKEHLLDQLIQPDLSKLSYNGFFERLRMPEDFKLVHFSVFQKHMESIEKVAQKLMSSTDSFDQALVKQQLQLIRDFLTLPGSSFEQYFQRKLGFSDSFAIRATSVTTTSSRTSSLSNVSGTLTPSKETSRERRSASTSVLPRPTTPNTNAGAPQSLTPRQQNHAFVATMRNDLMKSLLNDSRCSVERVFLSIGKRTVFRPPELLILSDAVICTSESPLKLEDSAAWQRIVQGITLSEVRQLVFRLLKIDTDVQWTGIFEPLTKLEALAFVNCKIGSTITATVLEDFIRLILPNRRRLASAVALPEYKLTRLIISECELKNDGLRALHLADLLKEFLPHLIDLDLSDNELSGHDFCEQLTRALLTRKTAAPLALNLAKNHTSLKGFAMLWLLVKRNRLSHLDLTNSPLFTQETSISNLAEYINSISATFGKQESADTVETENKLKVLGLSHVCLSAPHGKALLKWIKTEPGVFSTVNHLDLSRNRLESISALIEWLSEVTTTLNLVLNLDLCEGVPTGSTAENLSTQKVAVLYKPSSNENMHRYYQGSLHHRSGSQTPTSLTNTVDSDSFDRSFSVARYGDEGTEDEDCFEKNEEDV